MKGRAIQRALFVGLGGVGQRHLRNFVDVVGPGVELMAYRVRREQQVLSDALKVVPELSLEAHYGLTVFSSLEDALARRPDVTIVANPTSLHVAATRAALDAGSDVFVEKPLSHDLEGVEQLAAHAQQRGLIGFVGYQLRQHPDFRRLQGWLGEGRLGRVFCARFEVGEYLPDFHPYEDYRRMYAARSELGGGVTLTQIHEIDLCYALFGVPERVYSVGGRVSDLETDVEDMAVSILHYRSAGRLMPVEIHQDYLSRPKRRGVSILGERGRIEWNLSDGELRLYATDGSIAERHQSAELPRNRLFLDEMRHFVERVRARRPTEIGLEEGAASLRIALALRESQQRGVAVDLEQEAKSSSRSVMRPVLEARW
ncbi:MAG: Gfo/Idh/MocA family oxidoreductase [Polyangiaceae bacterium]